MFRRAVSIFLLMFGAQAASARAPFVDPRLDSGTRGGGSAAVLDPNCQPLFSNTDATGLRRITGGVELLDDVHTVACEAETLCAFEVYVGGGPLSFVDVLVTFYENDAANGPPGAVLAGPFTLTAPPRPGARVVRVETPSGSIREHMWVGMRTVNPAEEVSWMRVEGPAIGTSRDSVYLRPPGAYSDEGSVKADMYLVVYGGEHAPVCEVSPAAVDFDTVLIGSSAHASFVVRNAGLGVLAGELSEPCDHFSIVSGGGRYRLCPGESLRVGVRFAPGTPGGHACTVETGHAVCSDVQLAGVGREPFADQGAGLTGVMESLAAWGDYDGDGDLDLLLTGETSGLARVSTIYRNDAGSFADAGAGLTGVSRSGAAWGDYDNDGDLDLLLTGETAELEYVSKLYRNDAGAFVETAALPGVAFGAVAWGDHDNDGDLDALISGFTGAEFVSEIYRNDSGSFSGIEAGLPGVALGSVAWGDFDGDGDLDLLLAGAAPLDPISRLFRNDGGSFVDIEAGLTGAHSGGAAWGDHDNDGDPDILLAGASASGPISRVYRNDAGVFTDVAAGLPGVQNGSAAWGDYDNDGRLDVLIAGASASGEITRVYRNGGGGFTNIGAALPGVSFGGAAWGDHDGDLDLDLVLTGTAGGVPLARVYRNDSPIPDNPPSPPTNLSAQLTGDEATLSWDPSADDETPAPGLTYNLRIGTTPGGSEIVSAMSNAASGRRMLPRHGNAQHRTSWTIALPSPLEPRYYWSVQAVDPSFVGSAFAPEQTLVTLVEVNDRGPAPARHALHPATPNPFDRTAILRFDLPARQRVRLAVFDVSGQRVLTLVDGLEEAGRHAISWDGRNSAERPAPPGIYFVRMEARAFSAARMLVRLR